MRSCHIWLKVVKSSYLVTRVGVLGEAFGADVRARRRDERETHLAVARTRDNLAVAGEGHELGLEDVGLVAGLEGEHERGARPVPQAHLVVVRGAGEQRADAVEVERVHAALVVVERVRELHLAHQRQAAHRLVHKRLARLHAAAARRLGVPPLVVDESHRGGRARGGGW